MYAAHSCMRSIEIEPTPRARRYAPSIKLPNLLVWKGLFFYFNGWFILSSFIPGIITLM